MYCRANCRTPMIQNLCLVCTIVELTPQWSCFSWLFLTTIEDKWCCQVEWSETAFFRLDSQPQLSFFQLSAVYRPRLKRVEVLLSFVIALFFCRYSVSSLKYLHWTCLIKSIHAFSYFRWIYLMISISLSCSENRFCCWWKSFKNPVRLELLLQSSLHN